MKRGEIICPFCRKRIKNLQNSICKNCKHFLSADKIKTSQKVVYVPNRNSMTRGITDNAYSDFGFYPCDILTVKSFETDENNFTYILVNENDVRFSPHELIPNNEMSEELKMAIMEEFISLEKKYS